MNKYLVAVSSEIIRGMQILDTFHESYKEALKQKDWSLANYEHCTSDIVLGIYDGDTETEAENNACCEKSIRPDFLKAYKLLCIEEKPMKVFFADLTSTEKNKLINAFFDMYYNTNQDEEDFTKEYFYLAKEISKGRVPYNLEFLSNEFIDTVIEKIPRLEEYYKPFLEIDANN
jgi:hypothetical protein